jgi:hypothetical protein
MTSKEVLRALSTVLVVTACLLNDCLAFDCDGLSGAPSGADICYVMTVVVAGLLADSSEIEAMFTSLDECGT